MGHEKSGLIGRSDDERDCVWQEVIEHNVQYPSTLVIDKTYSVSVNHSFIHSFIHSLT